MELKNLVKLLKQDLYFIVGLVLAGALIGLYSTRFLPATYRQSQVFFISGPEAAGSSQDLFYKEENARNFTDTAVAILQSEEFIKSQAPIALEARKLAPQVIRITVQSASRENLTSSLENVSASFNQKIASLQEATRSSRLVPIAKAQEPSFFALNRATISAFGAVLGLIFSILSIALKYYFKI